MSEVIENRDKLAWEKLKLGRYDIRRDSDIYSWNYTSSRHHVSRRVISRAQQGASAAKGYKNELYQLEV